MEVVWKPGQDPHLDILRCSGSPPSKMSSGAEVLESISLSPFTTVQLHLLVQCSGLEVGEGLLAKVPEAGRVASAAVACEILAPIRQWNGFWLVLVAGFIVSLPLGWLIWRGLGPTLRRLVAFRATNIAGINKKAKREGPSVDKSGDYEMTSTSEVSPVRGQSVGAPAHDDFEV